eukprot:scaffold462_cov90-Cylindrotheca_fusiformis.AAC.1
MSPLHTVDSTTMARNVLCSGIWRFRRPSNAKFFAHLFEQVLGAPKFFVLISSPVGIEVAWTHAQRASLVAYI